MTFSYCGNCYGITTKDNKTFVCVTVSFLLTKFYHNVMPENSIYQLNNLFLKTKSNIFSCFSTSLQRSLFRRAILSLVKGILSYSLAIYSTNARVLKGTFKSPSFSNIYIYIYITCLHACKDVNTSA